MTDYFNHIFDDKTAMERFLQFCRIHSHDDPVKLRLSLFGNRDIPAYDRKMYDAALVQIEARRKYSSKFPANLRSDSPLIFPSMLAGEQSSHEYVADYHASLAGGADSLLDLTTGLGMDFMAMSRNINIDGRNCVAIEMDSAKCAVLRLNLKRFGLSAASVINAESIHTLEEMRDAGESFDLIFADPARRDADGGRLFDPADCSPDVIGNSGLLFDVAKRILVKNSPMMDISRGFRSFPGATRIYVISVRNECKEVLVEMMENGEPERVTAVDISADGRFREFHIQYDSIREDNIEYIGTDSFIAAMENDGLWLYEPSASLMKTSAWGEIGGRYGLKKVSPNCHLFVSESYNPDFQGRVTRIVSIIGKRDRKRLKGARRNVISRNYPEKADKIAVGMKLKPSDSEFIYAVTLGREEKPIMLDTMLDTTMIDTTMLDMPLDTRPAADGE